MMSVGMQALPLFNSYMIKCLIVTILLKMVCHVTHFRGVHITVYNLHIKCMCLKLTHPPVLNSTP